MLLYVIYYQKYSYARPYHDVYIFFFFSSIRPISRGGQINYREEEKKILDSILGRDVYDNRIRPSGRNGTGQFLLYVTNYQNKLIRLNMILLVL